ncbi:hypothetical protein KV557_09795 [Kitasatospora aureofaciens]|uniref:hypothetical protein n=1 Tax=Kitasatospora aureofaciens TaxID=1894 RepID=UPI001C44266B|nr:hypothetical protein [Kitasatospora aureofaciens]MBV6697415.1 hypothetical protein [Kitasatospora aureofaciens]
MSTLAVLGNNPHTIEITTRLARASHTVRTHGLPATDGMSAATAREAVADAIVVLTSFDSATAMSAAMADALPAMGAGTYWLDLSPAAHDNTHMIARAAQCGVTRIAAPLAELRGVLIAAVPAVLDLHSRLVCDPILRAAVDLVIRSSRPELGLVGLEAQFGDLAVPTS